MARADTSRDTLRMAAAAVPMTAGGKPLMVTRLRRAAFGADIIQTDRPLSRTDAETLMRQLASDPYVEHVEIDRLLQTAVGSTDGYYHEDQWPFDDFYDGHVNIGPAWEISRGAGTVIAIIDTGITAHPNLDSNILPGYDFISDPEVAKDGDGRDPDPTQHVNYADWHGTHVTGIAAAAPWNRTGVSGVAPEAKVVPIRAIGQQGGWMSDVLDAIVWAAGGRVDGVPENPHPAEVINLSLGENGKCTVAMQDAINIATSLGSVVVAAAGNNSSNVSTFMPANCQNIIAVGGSDVYGWPYVNSNYGDGIIVYAPGSWIFSTTNSGITSPTDPSLVYKSGTSMAAPHVVGVIALMQSASDMPLPPAQIKTVLRSTSRLSLAGLSLVDAGAAVRTAKEWSVNLPPMAEFTVAADGLSATFTDTSSGNGGIVSWLWDFGDGTSSTERHPTKTYAAAGTYAVTLTVANSHGITSSKSSPVTVVTANLPPIANFVATIDGLAVSFTDTSYDFDGEIGLWRWDFGDGTSSAESNPRKIYATTGTYAVTLTVTDDRGATGSKSIPVTIAIANVAPAADFSFAISNLSVRFKDKSHAPAGRIAMHAWDFGDGTSSTERHPRKTYPSAGTYTTTLTVTDDRGAVDSKSVPVTVAVANIAPMADFSFDIENLLVRFTDMSRDPEGRIVTHTWDFGDGTSSTETNPQKTYLSAGTHTVTLTVTDDRGAVDSKSVPVTVTAANVAPVADFSFDINQRVVRFTDASYDPDGEVMVRIWSFGDGTSSTETHPQKTYATAGTYTVILTVLDNFSMADVKYATVFIEEPEHGHVLSPFFPAYDLSGNAGETLFYTFDVPEGASDLTLQIYSGAGNADLYVRHGGPVSDKAFDCRPYRAGNDEACTWKRPAPGRYYLMIKGRSAFSRVMLLGRYM